MGLGITHGCWNGSYTAFDDFRKGVHDGKVLRRSAPGHRDLFLAQQQAADCMIHYDDKIDESLKSGKVVRRKQLVDQVMAKLTNKE